MSAADEIRELMADVRIQGRIEGVASCVETLDGFRALVDDGTIHPLDVVPMLDTLRQGMHEITVRAAEELSRRNGA